MIQTIDMLKEKYSDYINPLDKISRDSKQNKLFRLVRGIYETNSEADPLFLAGVIHSPSYLSFETALSYYGLIPERVYSITSASYLVGKNKTYINQFGKFTYSDIPPEVYYLGLTLIESGEYYAKIAMKEKAICDSLYKWSQVKNIEQLKELLFLDKRIDEDEFASCNFKLMIKIAKNYKKTNLKLLIQLIKEEYL